MTGRHFGLTAGGLSIGALLICSSYAAVEPGTQRSEVDMRMAAAAKETLKATRALHEVGRASVEDVYRWSQRTLEAEHSSDQAVKEHLDLMRDLHARAVAAKRAGAEGGEENILHATEYFLAQAESAAAK
jgi:hypothetical protein